MEAWVWPSDWGLVSIDCKCLQLITYAKFSGAPLTVHESGNPFWTPNSTLPVFRQNELQFASFGSVVNHLRTLKYSADYNLSAKQQAEVVAFGQLMEEKLYPALQYVFWLDVNNHSNLTRPWYFSKMYFPLKFYYPVSLSTTTLLFKITWILSSVLETVSWSCQTNYGKSIWSAV